jgi:cytochrome c oxidase subunit 3
MSVDAAHSVGPPSGFGKFGTIDRVMVGLITFLASEVMLFGAFFTAFFYVRYQGTYPVFPPQAYEIPKTLTGINTFILVSSSFTMHWSLEGARLGNRRAMKAGLLTTFLLGLTFLTIQINEYVHIGFAPHDHAQGTIFYGLTGLHGAHVFVGLTLLAMATIRAFRGHFTEKEHRGVEVPGIYWHFVDIMWIVVYTTVYII